MKFFSREKPEEPTRRPENMIEGARVRATGIIKLVSGEMGDLTSSDPTEGMDNAGFISEGSEGVVVHTPSEQTVVHVHFDGRETQAVVKINKLEVIEEKED